MDAEERDIEFARAALEAAEEGEGLASPNPLVGSVVVSPEGEIVGRGSHHYADRKHAEVVALEEAGRRAEGSTVYVNLEPCSHFGRTPPCVHALVEAKVARVVASMQDPAPYVDGRGFAMLREAGIAVSVGVERAAAERLNERYLRYITTGRPFVLVKLAATLDGRVATHAGASQWLTGPESREASHELRRRYDAILVGVNTAIADDPELTYRGAKPKREPLLRAVVDPRLRLPLASRLVASAKDAPLVVYARTGAGDTASAHALRERGVDVVEIAPADGAVEGAGRLDLAAVLDDMGRRRISGLVVEGGPETAASFVEARLVDKVTFFLAPRVLGGRASVGAVGGGERRSIDDALVLGPLEVRTLGDDVEITGYPRR